MTFDEWRDAWHAKAKERGHVLRHSDWIENVVDDFVTSMHCLDMNDIPECSKRENESGK